MQAISGVSRLLLAASLTAGLAGCRALGTKEGASEPNGAAADGAAAGGAAAGGEEVARGTTLPVGVVQHVDADARFVLIRSSRGFQIEPGTILTIRGNRGEGVATVKVSPARKGAFLTADFVEGIPSTGQTATLEHRPPAASGGADPFVPAASDAGAVQILE